MNESLRINSPRVACEIIDGEVVMIDFESGRYYSVRGVGAQVIDLIAAGATRDALVREIGRRYPAERELAERGVAEFLDTLEREQLVVAGTGGSAVRSDAAPPPVLPFAPPTLERFDDLQDLLLLDPIHDVDEAGWPVVSKAG